MNDINTTLLSHPWCNFFSIIVLNVTCAIDGIREELKQAHSDAVTECVKNADKLTDMHNQIVSCDQVFEASTKIQYLSRFTKKMVIRVQVIDRSHFS